MATRTRDSGTEWTNMRVTTTMPEVNADGHTTRGTVMVWCTYTPTPDAPDTTATPDPPLLRFVSLTEHGKFEAYALQVLFSLDFTQPIVFKPAGDPDECTCVCVCV